MHVVMGQCGADELESSPVAQLSWISGRKRWQGQGGSDGLSGKIDVASRTETRDFIRASRTGKRAKPIRKLRPPPRDVALFERSRRPRVAPPQVLLPSG